MERSLFQLTTAQFAKLHGVNKRTLHYYDSIGLFSPSKKGSNGYRYYDISQSIDFEYIRMLKDLNMSIEEIAEYLQYPSPENFKKIAKTKLEEIDKQIQCLKQTKKILCKKKEQVDLCETLDKSEIKIIECEKEKILRIPYNFAENDISDLFYYIKDTWNIDQIRMGIGSFISIDKVIKKQFEMYDGIYTPALACSVSNKSIVKPAGKYLCGYQKGTWDKLPSMYERLIDYANEHSFRLTGYSYEMGLNEFMITTQDDYITQIMIKIE